jgi:hypothetical protein
VPQLCPDENVLKELDASLDLDKWSPADSKSTPLDTDCTAKALIPGTPTEIITKAIRESGDPLVALDEDDIKHLKLADHMMSLHIDPTENRFFGKSSGVMLIQTAIDLKHEYIGQPDRSKEGILGARRPEFWTIRPVRDSCNFVFIKLYSNWNSVGESFGPCRGSFIHLPRG